MAYLCCRYAGEWHHETVQTVWPDPGEAYPDPGSGNAITWEQMMKTLEQRVRKRVRERLQQQQRQQAQEQRKLDRIVAIAIINGVLLDLGVAKAMDQEQAERLQRRIERRQRKQRERDHRLAVGIINGVMARMGMPWPEIEAKAARGWRVGGGLRWGTERR